MSYPSFKFARNEGSKNRSVVNKKNFKKLSHECSRKTFSKSL